MFRMEQNGICSEGLGWVTTYKVRNGSEMIHGKEKKNG